MESDLFSPITIMPWIKLHSNEIKITVVHMCACQAYTGHHHKLTNLKHMRTPWDGAVIMTIERRENRDTERWTALLNVLKPACGIAKIWTQARSGACVSAKWFQSCLTLCDPMDWSPPGSSVHGILQASVLEWVATPSSRDLPYWGIKPKSLKSPALAGRFFIILPPGKPPGLVSEFIAMSWWPLLKMPECWGKVLTASRWSISWVVPGSCKESGMTWQLNNTDNIGTPLKERVNKRVALLLYVMIILKIIEV